MADTLIGKGIVVDGEITGTAPVTVEGTVKGRIDLDSTVIVAASGLVEADVLRSPGTSRRVNAPRSRPTAG